MKTSEKMLDRARARQQRISDNKALLHEVRQRHQERQRKDVQPGTAEHQATSIKEDSAKPLMSEHIQNAPIIARNLREQILAQNPSIPGAGADGVAQASGSENDRQARLLKELCVATIRRIERGEWNEYFQSLITVFVRESEAEKISSKLKSESE